MTQSRFFSNKPKNDYVVSSVASLEDGRKLGILVIKDYTYAPELEDFIKRYALGPVHGVHVRILAAHETEAGKAQVHIVLHPPVGINFSASEQEFRTAVAKLNYIRGHHSRDAEEITSAFRRYLIDEGLQEQHAARTCRYSTGSGAGNAY